MDNSSSILLVLTFIALNTITLTISTFVCIDGNTVDVNKVCDGKLDCKDGSDERKALCLHRICKTDQFKCYYGACIPRAKACNKDKDCADGSDENQCGKDKKSCEKDEFKCDSGSCVKASTVCDSKIDCPDGSDEKSGICEKRLCPLDSYRCKYGGCIPADGICNGVFDCLDGSDESKALCDKKSSNKCPAVRSTRLEIICQSDKGVVPCDKPIDPKTKAKYSCKNFFLPADDTLKDNTESVCQQDGVWSRDILECKPDCGKLDKVIPLIVKGWTTKEPFPWQVTLFVMHKGDWAFWCGGSLISEAVVLTAGHCLFGIEEKNIQIAVGKFRSNFTILPEEKNAKIYKIKRILNHPLYMDKNGNYASDIALLEVDGTIEFNNFIRPVCIDWSLDDITSHLTHDNVGIIMGMGLTETDTYSTEMRVTKLPVVSNEKCIKKQDAEFRKYVSFTAFCAGWGNGTGVCNGDSGGGLYFPMKNDRWCVQGLVSLSPRRLSTSFCDPEKYTIFTKVGLYVKWIKHMLDEIHATHEFTKTAYDPIL